MNEHILDVDDFLDEQNKGFEPDPIHEAADAMADTILMNDENIDMGNKIIDSYANDMYIELYEKSIKGRGYDYNRLKDFRYRIHRIEYVYAHNGNLHICSKSKDRYTVPNLANIEMLAFLINRQIGVDKTIENTSSD